MWEKVAPKLRKEFKFSNFKQAIEFVNRIAEVAEELNHHPDIHIYYNRVIVETWTHSKNDITEKDEELAREIDKLLSH